MKTWQAALAPIDTGSHSPARERFRVVGNIMTQIDFARIYAGSHLQNGAVAPGRAAAPSWAPGRIGSAGADVLRIPDG
jgi:hypothetical protein